MKGKIYITLFIILFSVHSCKNSNEQEILELEKSIAEDNRLAAEAKLEEEKELDEYNNFEEQAKIKGRDDPEKIKERLAKNERLEKAFKEYQKNPNKLSKMSADEQIYILSKNFKMQADENHDKNEYARVVMYDASGYNK
jgi:hypothetical protein